MRATRRARRDGAADLVTGLLLGFTLGRQGGETGPGGDRPRPPSGSGPRSHPAMPAAPFQPFQPPVLQAQVIPLPDGSEPLF